MNSTNEKPTTTKTEEQKKEEPQPFSIEYFLLKGPMPELAKMSKNELKAECEMWRRLWAWVPDEVKYFVARTGKEIGLTLRNYKRYLGQLLETHWKLEEIEVGVYDKVYDFVTGKYFLEKKIVKLNASAVLDVQWIETRIPEEKLTEEEAPPPEEIPPPEEMQGGELGSV